MITSNIFVLLEKENLFSSMDIQFASFINSFYKTNNFLILLSLFLSHHTRIGNMYLSLSELYAYIYKYKYLSYIINNLWNRINLNNKTNSNLFSTDYLMLFHKVISTTCKPIILDNKYLFLYKVWKYVNRLKNFFMSAAAEYDHVDNLLIPENQTLLIKLLQNVNLNTQQKIALLMTLINKLTIITGGPGTGKTSFLLQILKAIKLIYQKKNLLIYLLAPTGKSTVKLMYLINLLQKDKFCKNIIINIENISTIHKRLKSCNNIPDILYKYTKLVDILIIDEVSMVNLELMDKVINTIYHHKTKLILIGDPYQLNAVSSIGIIRHIINWIINNSLYKNTNLKIIKKKYELPILGNNIVVLKHLYRYYEYSGIAQLANAIKKEDVIFIKKLYFKQNIFTDITWFSWEKENLYKLLINNCVKNCKSFLNKINNIENIIHYLNDLQILCLLNKGQYGTDIINDLVEQNLNLSSTHWYIGKPIIILKNDPELLLYNGEIGITIFNHLLGEWEVIFFSYTSTKGLQIRNVKLKYIKHFKTAWSITIHKAQGSEFNQVILILPPIGQYTHSLSTLITKELIYTAITRAKKRLTIYASLDTIVWGVKNKISLLW